LPNIDSTDVGQMIRFFGMRILFFIAAFGLMFGLVHAQERQQNVPGQFDYYILSLVSQR
jgi:hypothetical protein